jgi:hypothetical protein
MSVILLSASPWMLDSILERDPDAAVVPGTNAILASQKAVMCPETANALFKMATRPRDLKAPRKEFDLPGGFRLRITRDSAVMGPLRFLAVKDNCWAPWGVWTIYKGGPNLQNVDKICMHEAIDAYYAARSFTHEHTERSLAYAKRLNYYASPNEVDQLKREAMLLTRTASRKRPRDQASEHTTQTSSSPGGEFSLASARDEQDSQAPYSRHP